MDDWEQNFTDKSRRRAQRERRERRMRLVRLSLAGAAVLFASMVAISLVTM